MVRKSIAATLLIVMMSWAEMALAPMLFMRAGHVHAAVEKSGLTAAHHHAAPSGGSHPCCPGLGKSENLAAVEFFAAGSLPCQDEHRCCFQQGPQSMPAPARAGQRLSRDVAPVEVAELAPDQAKSHVFAASAVAFSPPPIVLGMILRI